MHTLTTGLLRALAALLLMLGAWTPAAAQRSADEGEYQILQALYGTAQHHVDVTARLRELARTDRSFRFGNDTFGTDPHPNQVKTLRIYARGRDGTNRTFEYTEGSTVDGARFTGWGGGKWGQEGRNGGWDGDDGEYQILQALYGTSQHHVDVTQRLKELARADRRFRMGNDTFGVDPHPNQVKTLRIHARARDKSIRLFEFAEGGTIDGALFTGWGRGDWGHGNYNGGWGGDDGEYRILRARYGTAMNNVDVTAQLKELARADRRFRMGNDSFGVDPHPNQVKSLRIYARARDGGHRMFEYAEGSVIDGALFTSWGQGDWGQGGGGNAGWGEPRRVGPVPVAGSRNQLVVVSASYGAGDHQQDVTNTLRSLVRGDRLDVLADNRMAGSDPAPGTPKTLWVTYTVGGGREMRTLVRENEALRLP